MKVYWDTSALILALQDRSVRRQLEKGTSFSRSHALSEVFSIMTGGRLGFRCDANEVAELIQELLHDITIVDLQPSEIVAQLKLAKAKGVRGGGVYDYLHAATAVHFNCDELLTLNLKDFEGQFDELGVREPE